MIDRVVGFVLWLFVSSLMVVALSAVVVINIPVLLFAMVFDRHLFVELIDCYQSSYADK